MVRRFLCCGLALALWAQPCVSSLLWAEAVPAAVPPPASAGPLSGSALAVTARAAVGLAPLPGRPAPVPYVANHPMEDFTAVTLISLPFTALWSLLGAVIVGGIAQHQWPPTFDTPLLTGAAAAALGASVTIGLVSVRWGGPKPKLSPTPSPSATPTPQP